MKIATLNGFLPAIKFFKLFTAILIIPSVYQKLNFSKLFSINLAHIYFYSFASFENVSKIFKIILNQYEISFFFRLYPRTTLGSFL